MFKSLKGYYQNRKIRNAINALDADEADNPELAFQEELDSANLARSKPWLTGSWLSGAIFKAPNITTENEDQETAEAAQPWQKPDDWQKYAKLDDMLQNIETFKVSGRTEAQKKKSIEKQLNMLIDEYKTLAYGTTNENALSLTQELELEVIWTRITEPLEKQLLDPAGTFVRYEGNAHLDDIENLIAEILYKPNDVKNFKGFILDDRLNITALAKLFYLKPLSKEYSHIRSEIIDLYRPICAGVNKTFMSSFEFASFVQLCIDHCQSIYKLSDRQPIVALLQLAVQTAVPKYTDGFTINGFLDEATPRFSYSDLDHFCKKNELVAANKLTLLDTAPTNLPNNQIIIFSDERVTGHDITEELFICDNITKLHHCHNLSNTKKGKWYTAPWTGFITFPNSGGKAASLSSLEQLQTEDPELYELLNTPNPILLEPEWRQHIHKENSASRPLLCAFMAGIATATAAVIVMSHTLSSSYTNKPSM